MNIVIDTTIFRQDRRLEKSDLLLLRKLSKLGLIKIHIPWVVYKESTSQNYLEIQDAINKIVKELKGLKNKGLSEKEHLQFEKLSKEIETVDIRDSVNQHWESFINDSNAVLYEIEDNDGRNVMLSYFLGEPPFPNPKSRKDIPDAFIYQTVKSLSNALEQIYVITNDNNLRKECNEIPNVVGLKDFSELYNLVEYEPIDEEYKRIEHFADELLILEDRIEEIKTKAEKDVWDEILNDIIIESDNIPDDNKEGRLVGIEKISSVKIDKSKIQFIYDVFYIPIEVEGVFTIEYFLFKSDYFVYEGNRSINITDGDWNKHFFLVEESFECRLTFKYKIEKENVEDMFFEAEDVVFEEVNLIQNE